MKSATFECKSFLRSFVLIWYTYCVIILCLPWLHQYYFSLGTVTKRLETIVLSLGIWKELSCTCMQTVMWAGLVHTEHTKSYWTSVFGVATRSFPEPTWYSSWVQTDSTNLTIYKVMEPPSTTTASSQTYKLASTGSDKCCKVFTDWSGWELSCTNSTTLCIL